MDKIKIRIVETRENEKQVIIITRFDRRENGHGRPQRHEFNGPITLKSRDRLRRFVGFHQGKAWSNEHEVVIDIC